MIPVDGSDLSFNDLIAGGSHIDVIFSGWGSDATWGGDEPPSVPQREDFIFADAQYNSVTNSGELLFGDAVIEYPGDSINGGQPVTGDNASQLGHRDVVTNIGGILIDGGACKDVITWLRAQFKFLNKGEAPFHDLVTQAFAALGVTLRAMDYEPTDIQTVWQETSGEPESEGDRGGVLPWHNAGSPLDVNEDGLVTPLDALLVINLLNRSGPASVEPLSVNRSGPGSVEPLFAPTYYPDVNGDRRVTPLDALLVINALNARRTGPSRSEGEGEGESPDALISENIDWLVESRRDGFGAIDGQRSRESAPDIAWCLVDDLLLVRAPQGLRGPDWFFTQFGRELSEDELWKLDWRAFWERW